MACNCRRHRCVERAQLIRIGRKVRIAVRHALPEQSQRGNRPRDVGSAESVPRNGCASMVRFIRSVSSGVERNSKPFLRKVWRRAGPAHHAEIRMVRGERTREIARCLLGLFRHVRVDHRDQQPLELRESAIQRHGTLPPGQRRGKHLVGVGVHAEMAARIEARTRGKQHSGEHHHPGMPAARIDETNECALEQGRAGIGAAHPVVPPDRLATLCSRPATSAGVPPELSRHENPSAAQRRG